MIYHGALDVSHSQTASEVYVLMGVVPWRWPDDTSTRGLLGRFKASILTGDRQVRGAHKWNLAIILTNQISHKYVFSISHRDAYLAGRAANTTLLAETVAVTMTIWRTKPKNDPHAHKPQTLDSDITPMWIRLTRFGSTTWRLFC